MLGAATHTKTTGVAAAVNAASMTMTMADGAGSTYDVAWSATDQWLINSLNTVRLDLYIYDNKGNAWADGGITVAFNSSQVGSPTLQSVSGARHRYTFDGNWNNNGSNLSIPVSRTLTVYHNGAPIKTFPFVHTLNHNYYGNKVNLPYKQWRSIPSDAKGKRVCMVIIDKNPDAPYSTNYTIGNSPCRFYIRDNSNSTILNINPASSGTFAVNRGFPSGGGYIINLTNPSARVYYNGTADFQTVDVGQYQGRLSIAPYLHNDPVYLTPFTMPSDAKDIYFDSGDSIDVYFTHAPRDII